MFPETCACKKNQQEDYSKVGNLMKTSCVMPATKSLEVDLLGLIQCEEEDAKTNAEELKDHENRNKSVNLNLDAEDGRNKKNKDNVDQ